MRYNREIHSKGHLVKSILGRIEHVITGTRLPGGELTVVNYHGTQQKYLDNFKRQLDLYESLFAFITPQQVKDYFSNALQPATRPFLLLTFDDGLKNNLLAVEEMNRRNIKGMFFVIPDYIDTPTGSQKDFFIKNIRPHINPAIDCEPEDFTAMSWSELRDLRSQGHEIGSHTCTHTLLSTDNTEKSRYEVAESKKKIINALSLTDEDIDAYCSINESSLSTGTREMTLIKQHYKYFYTTYPGSNLDKNPYFIKRSNVESFWLEGTVLNAIGKWDRARWKSKIEAFKKTTELY